MTIQKLIAPNRRHLGGGFHVLRSLPALDCASVGPFVFVDQMGPLTLEAGQGLDVRPHPHIGLATLTYLYEGAITHRDSLGSVATVNPGDVGWMVAGRGIVHSERSPDAWREKAGPMLGLQCWVALPSDLEECEPSYVHVLAAALPAWNEAGVTCTLAVGSWRGRVSPVTGCSPTVFASLSFEPTACLSWNADHEERAVFVVDGDLEVAGQKVAAGELAVLTPKETVLLQARAATRAVVLGGAPFLQSRHLSWNFVSTRPERIDQARQAWTQYASPPFLQVPGETEFIPLPAA